MKEKNKIWGTFIKKIENKNKSLANILRENCQYKISDNFFYIYAQNKIIRELLKKKFSLIKTTLDGIINTNDIDIDIKNIKKLNKTKSDKKVSVSMSRIKNVLSKNSLLAILLCFPQFRNLIKKIRQDMHINPRKVKKKFYKAFSKKYDKKIIDAEINGLSKKLAEKLLKLPQLLKIYSDTTKEINFSNIPSNKRKYLKKLNLFKKDLIAYDKSIDLYFRIVFLKDSKHEWEINKFPKLYTTIFKELEKIGLIVPSFLIFDIKDYILYNNIPTTGQYEVFSKTETFFNNFLLKSKSGEFDEINNIFRIVKSPKDLINKYPNWEDIIFRPYIEIKIYGSTKITLLRKILPKIRKLQGRYLFAEYRYFSGITKSNIAKYKNKILYYYLRKIESLTHKKANKILKSLGLKTISYQYASQSLFRCEQKYISQKKTNLLPSFNKTIIPRIKACQTLYVAYQKDILKKVHKSIKNLIKKIDGLIKTINKV